MKHLRTFLFCMLSGVLMMTRLHADVSPSDMQVMARALKFLERPLSGDVTVGIIYSPQNAQSVREAESIQRMLSGGLKVGNLTLTGVTVSLDELARANVGLLFLTAGLDEGALKVAASSRSRQIPCVTTDLAQVKSGRCAMGIRSQPKIEILVNRAAAAASGSSFSQVFRMMVTEL